MIFSVAYTFDQGIIPKLAQFPEVKEIFGKLGSDLLGGGRSSYMVADANRKKLEDAVKESKKHHIEFNYLLNAANLDGFEQTRSGQKKIRKFLDFLSNLGINNVTVSIPYLLKIIKYSYPHFKTRVGVFARIASPASAKWWEEMGADVLCVSSISCNRNLRLLKSIRTAVKCDLQLIANANCLQDCPFELAHMNMLTHASRSGARMHSFNLDYCFLHCSAIRYRDKTHFLKSIWIRPEDLSQYEKLGYTNFKIIDRGCPPDLLIKRVKAYSERSFNGNLMELIAPAAKIRSYDGLSRGGLAKVLPFIRPDKIKLNSIIEIKRFVDDALLTTFDKNPPIYIENKMLDGYLEKVFAKGCTSADCSGCSYCSKFSEEIVRIKTDYHKRVISQIDVLEKGLADGSIF